jgi:hypothetical protein
MPRRHKNVDWNLPESETGALKTWDMVHIAVLMDIRDELKQLNTTLGCYRVQRMCDDVNRIERRLKQHMPLGKGRGK